MARPDWKYYFADFEDQWLKLPLDEETYTKLVCQLVDALWARKGFWRLPSRISDDELHHKYIDFCRERYRYPDFLELVGPPKPEHYDEHGQLTTQRKSTLLLIGPFEWQGIRIAKHKAIFGFNLIRGWYGERRYTRDQRGWYVPVARIRPDAKRLTVRDYFTPLRNYRCVRLENHLTPDKKYTAVTFRDDNPYNCHPDNVQIVSTRGRPKTCHYCEERVTDRTSRRIKLSGRYIRCCLTCLSNLGTGTVREGGFSI